MEFYLPVSDRYQVRINDSRFRTTFAVKIAGGVTSLIVTAHRLVYQVSFEELSDSQSAGWTMALQNDYLAVDTRGTQANLTGIVFLEIERNSSGPIAATKFDTGPLVDQIRLVILSVISTRDATFLKVSPLKDIKVSGILRTLIVTYVPTVGREV